MRRTPSPTDRSGRPGARRAGLSRAALLVLAVVTVRASGVASATAPGVAPSTPAPAKRSVTGSAKPPAARAKPAARSAPARKPMRELASDARALEEIGAYGQAREALRQLRGRVALDADLELALALDEARTGQTDSAAARLWSPLLDSALVDSTPPKRFVSYPSQREGAWMDGRFGGWHWYVARARAEVAASQGRWEAARDAARQAVAARARAGKEWLILAICSGHAGDAAESERAAREAAWLDPTLPEALYVRGLYDWRAGRRLAAQEAFRGAIALDSSYRAPALALVRSRLPGAPPDSLPGELLTGIRAVALLTSTARPKLEEFEQMDSPALILHQEILPMPDSLKGHMPKVKLNLPILVTENGRAALHDLPWFEPDGLPEVAQRITLESLIEWRFAPAIRFGQPRRVWANIQITYQP